MNKLGQSIEGPLEFVIIRLHCFSVIAHAGLGLIFHRYLPVVTDTVKTVAATMATEVPELSY